MEGDDGQGLPAGADDVQAGVDDRVLEARVDDEVREPDYGSSAKFEFNETGLT